MHNNAIEALSGVPTIRTAKMAGAEHNHGPMTYVDTTVTTADDDGVMLDTIKSTTVAPGDPTLLIDSGGAVSGRQCVYSYEDKYAFARILKSDSLIFDSHFESGNLHSAYRVLNNALDNYDLYMHDDINTTGHRQWFYFSVKNTKPGQRVTFNIRNYIKPDSLFNEGMRPVFLSTRSGRGWTRTGTNIRYFFSPNEILEPTSSSAGSAGTSGTSGRTAHGTPPPPAGAPAPPGEVAASDEAKGSTTATATSNHAKTTKSVVMTTTGTFVLTFTHTFEYTDDKCYFAYALPYTFTDLQKHLQSLESRPERAGCIKRSQLCRTIAGNLCPLLTITAPARSVEELNSRVTVVFTARVHPGETNASWIMHGLLEFLTDPVSRTAALLRDQFVFKVIPMLNPDGVINGNYRCSLAGCDLNRRWVRASHFDV